MTPSPLRCDRQDNNDAVCRAKDRRMPGRT